MKGEKDMREIEYNREAAVDYARRWAFSRNPKYYDFSDIGGDCTNFVSQCIYAGTGVMNYTKDFGWYYISTSNRSPSWTGVEFLYDFLVNNDSVGPYAVESSKDEMEIGDVIQLGRDNGDFYHSLVIVGTYPMILVASHSYDALDRPLYSYNYYTARFLHIEGVRKWE